MSEKTAISWTDATWSPWEGCTKVSPGCDNCYAASMNNWLRKGSNWGPGAPRRQYSDAHWNKPLAWNAKAEKAGTRLRVFPSVCDPFDNEVDEARRRDFLWLVEHTPSIDWLLLTKRIGNAAGMLADLGYDEQLPNVWLGATVVNREEMLRDAPKLKAIPARVRFWSYEPALGDLGEIPRELMPDWVIAGGESGRHARPVHPDWFRSLRDQCETAGVAFHFKQHGEWAPGSGDFGQGGYRTAAVASDGSVVEGGHDRSKYPSGAESSDGWSMVHWAGKKAAGSLLDGVEHKAFPA